ncbi:MAG TPA: OsmC family protein [Bryobacteraceae bacterium]|nr:OsmC family protein [Bryobacteraceae bacterium]
MELIVDYIGGTALKTKIRDHEVVCDQPVGNGGQDAGMSPPEFLLASLGTCAGFYATQYLRARSLPAEGVRVTVSAEKAVDKPARLGSFHINVIIPGLEDERHKEGVMRAVKSCLIHNTLLHPPAIEIALETRSDQVVAGH